MISLKFNPFPTLITGRLLLRKMEKKDEADIFRLRSNDDVLRFVDIAKAETVEDAMKFIEMINSNIEKNESVMWGMEQIGESGLIGTICYWNIVPEVSQGEIGYMLHPSWQGKGLMHEALTKVIDYGFTNITLRTIVAAINPANIPSKKVLERLGFTFKETEDDMIVYELENPAIAYDKNRSPD
jgi:ribosomal-protein-alanine N-acetyltransferase